MINNKSKLIILLSIAIIVLASVSSVVTGMGVDSVYTPSNITKANPIVLVPDSDATFDTIYPWKLKSVITHTVIGTVKSVGSPIDWTDSTGDVHGSVPVTLDVIEVTKGNVTGNTITFYVDSFKRPDGTYWLMADEPEFEIDEKVLVHLSPDPDFGHADGILYPTIGKYTKYQIIDGKAYNHNWPTGVSLHLVKNEAKWFFFF